jgi:hypothetical protein
LANYVLNLDDPAGRARYVQQIFQERRGAAFALPEVSHQETYESGQPRPALSARNACGQLAASGDATARAKTSLELVLGHDRLDLGKFPDLVTNRRRVASGKHIAAAAALARNAGNHLTASLSGYQRAKVALVSLLATLLAAALGRFALGPGVRMLGARWYRGVARRQLLDPLFESFDPRLVPSNQGFYKSPSRLCLRRQFQSIGML